MRAESSAAARKGAFVAVTVALFCVQLDFFALNLAIPGMSAELGVTVSAAQWTLSAYMLAIGCFFIVGGRPPARDARQDPSPVAAGTR
ncbi:hypothetical protein J7F03_19465 [Streptomyces sp. ISL-43]|uniref:hypothetical protein n=1 Tax=Streptomyces sp. ISL-43 TaxID=2819183 RepID=UPI001BED1787|nr:hypothetical protein [Streptomyces sp. ISL-43]MBT2449232.1 hypothetical protein [Streptomyces sp. ISL-43]